MAASEKINVDAAAVTAAILSELDNIKCKAQMSS